MAKQAERYHLANGLVLTSGELNCLQACWWAAKDASGLDFGITEEVGGVRRNGFPKGFEYVSKKAAPGLLSALQKKGIISIAEPVTTDAGTFRQFTFTKLGEACFTHFLGVAAAVNCVDKKAVTNAAAAKKVNQKRDLEQVKKDIARFDGDEACVHIPFDVWQEALSALGFANQGGGRNFISYFRSASKGELARTVYLFDTTYVGSGPSDIHWVEVNESEDIVAGGFTLASLARFS